MPYGIVNSSALLPGSLLAEISAQLGIPKERCTYIHILNQIVAGTDVLQDMLVSLSQFEAPVSETIGIQTHDTKNAKKIFLGTVFSLEIMHMGKKIGSLRSTT